MRDKRVRTCSYVWLGGGETERERERRGQSNKETDSAL